MANLVTLIGTYKLSQANPIQTHLKACKKLTSKINKFIRMTFPLQPLLYSMLDTALTRIFIPAIPVGVVHVWCQETYSKEVSP